MTQIEKKDSPEMFDRIAKTYDLVNRLISFGLDKGWRRKVSRRIPEREELFLVDLATGTADLIIGLVKAHPSINKATGVDLSEGMLEVGRKKVLSKQLDDRIKLISGDAQAIPMEDDSVAVITISFGIRNVPDVDKCLAEMRRVIDSDGKVMILEFSLPKNPIIRFGHLFYLRWVLPLVGGIVSGDFKAYRYLNTTIESFPYGEAFCEKMLRAGFGSATATPLSFGIATLYEGKK